MESKPITVLVGVKMLQNWLSMAEEKHRSTLLSALGITVMEPQTDCCFVCRSRPRAPGSRSKRSPRPCLDPSGELLQTIWKSDFLYKMNSQHKQHQHCIHIQRINCGRASCSRPSSACYCDFFFRFKAGGDQRWGAFTAADYDRAGMERNKEDLQ